MRMGHGEGGSYLRLGLGLGRSQPSSPQSGEQEAQVQRPRSQVLGIATHPQQVLLLLSPIYLGTERRSILPRVTQLLKGKIKI